MPVSKVYRNDGGVFNDIGAALTGVYRSSVAWGDYDNDGDLDVLLTGDLSDRDSISKVYRNDGGAFTDIGAALFAAGRSSVGWGDYDNDGDLDILLTGSHRTKVYRNESPVANAVPEPPTDLDASMIADGVMLSWEASTDGQTPPPGLTYNLRVGTTPGGAEVVSPMALSTGHRKVARKGNTDHVTLTFVQPLPAGTYYWSVQAIDTAFAGSEFSTESSFSLSPPTLSIEDATVLEGDSGTTDAVFTLRLSRVSFLTVTADYFTSDGSATSGVDFVASSGRVTFPAGETEGTITVPVNGDLLNEGNESFFVHLTLPTNAAIADAQGLGTILNEDCPVVLTPMNASFPAGGGKGSFAVSAADDCVWSAVSNTTWLSMTSGASGSGKGSVEYSVAPNTSESRAGTIAATNEMFTVNQSGVVTFTDIGAALTSVRDSSVAWGDYDNDGDLDILLTGYSNSWLVSKVYRNDEGDTFTDIGAALVGVEDGSVAWGDYDNDGDLDILLTGCAKPRNYISKVYRNDGGDLFTDIGAALIGVDHSSVAWGDYDNDGDLDVLLTGWSPSAGAVSKIYRNDGGDSFADIEAALIGVDHGSVAWGDYDNDGDLDILLTGIVDPWLVSKVYRNDGGGAFTDVGASLTEVHSGSVAWGDYDNDSDLDILLTGRSSPIPGVAPLSPRCIGTMAVTSLLISMRL